MIGHVFKSLLLVCLLFILRPVLQDCPNIQDARTELRKMLQSRVENLQLVGAEKSLADFFALAILQNAVFDYVFRVTEYGAERIA